MSKSGYLHVVKIPSRAVWPCSIVFSKTRRFGSTIDCHHQCTIEYANVRSNTLVPVSYTHLDVYKRQVCVCVCVWYSLNRFCLYRIPKQTYLLPHLAATRHPSFLSLFLVSSLSLLYTTLLHAMLSNSYRVHCWPYRVTRQGINVIRQRTQKRPELKY